MRGRAYELRLVSMSEAVRGINRLKRLVTISTESILVIRRNSQ